jgi:hypothetical protein
LSVNVLEKLRIAAVKEVGEDARLFCTGAIALQSALEL